MYFFRYNAIMETEPEGRLWERSCRTLEETGRSRVENLPWNKNIYRDMKIFPVCEVERSCRKSTEFLFLFYSSFTQYSRELD